METSSARGAACLTLRDKALRLAETTFDPNTSHPMNRKETHSTCCDIVPIDSNRVSAIVLEIIRTQDPSAPDCAPYGTFRRIQGFLTDTLRVLASPFSQILIIVDTGSFESELHRSESISCRSFRLFLLSTISGARVPDG